MRAGAAAGYLSHGYALNLPVVVQMSQDARAATGLWSALSVSLMGVLSHVETLLTIDLHAFLVMV